MPRRSEAASRSPRRNPMQTQPIVASTALLVAGVLVVWLSAAAPNRADKGKPFMQVPDTVSPEARKYLETLPDPATIPAWPAPDDVAGWKKAWDATEAASEPKV